MYPLLAIYLQLYGLCAENGLDPAGIAKMLQGREHKITETDRAMWDLVDEARRLDVGSIFAANEAPDIRQALADAGGNASVWLTKFDDFLQVYGHRTEGIADINIPSWIEDNTSPLGQLKNFIESGERHDFDAHLQHSIDERDRVVDEARSQLSGDALGAFDQLLGICQVANFAWWNEEHNYYIDLRASIPIRTGALAIGRELGVDRKDEATFMFFPELLDVCRGRVQYADIRSMVQERAAYYDSYQDKRQDIPKVVGNVPERVDDPVLIEIFGMHSHYFAGLKADAHVTELTGFPASAGTYTGRARVMLSAMELFELEDGEILVTEATSPNWTPAFAIIGACVCDGGGSLTHAATVSREYGIPCVVGTSVATMRIKSGDLIEVDGSKGTVKILERATA
jgi:pyruvate,water dikinase